MLDKKTKEKIIKLIKEKKTLSEIMKTTKVSSTAVVNLAQNNNLTITKTKSWNEIPENVALVINYFKQGFSIPDIAKKKDVKASEPTIRLLLNDKKLITKHKIQKVKKEANNYKEEIRELKEEIKVSNKNRKQWEKETKKLLELETKKAYEAQMTYLKNEASEVRKKLKKEYTKEGTIDKIIMALRETTEPIKKLNIAAPKFNSNLQEEKAVLVLSDIHAGEIVSKEEMGGLNSYDSDIMINRLDDITNGIFRIHEILSKGYRLQELTVYGLGDWLTGIIHDELVETAEVDIVTTLQTLTNKIAEIFISLLKIFKTIRFVGVVGNHGRMTQKKRFKRIYVNWDYLAYDRIKLLCSNYADRINFIIPKSFFYLDKIYDHRILLLHGDNVRGWMGIPWYGIQRMVSKFSQVMAQKREFIDYVILAHFHNTGAVQTPTGEMFINGSLIGGNEFSMGALALTNEPQQLFMGVSKHKGVTFRYPLKVRG